MRAQALPQPVGQRLRPRPRGPARGASALVHRTDRLIYCAQNIGDANVRCGPRKAIAAARPAHRFHEPLTPQLHEQLL